jgi:hypothetical protein
MLAMLLESTGTRCMLSWMRMSLGRIGGGSFCFQAPGHRLLDAVNGLIRRIGSSYELAESVRQRCCRSRCRHLHIARPRIPGRRKQGLSREVPDRNPDTKGSHGIGGGEIRKAQKACESSTLTARTVSCSDVKLPSPISICVITSWHVMSYCNTCVHCTSKTARIPVTPTSKTLAQQQDGRRRGPAFRRRREPLPA